MKSIQIVDASVAVKWFVDETGRDASLEVLQAIKENPRLFVVPELFFNEMLSVLCKIVRDESDIAEAMTLLESLGFSRLANGATLVRSAIRLSKHYHLSGYDAIYAATAKAMDGLWLTCDERAHKKIASLSISKLVM